MKNCKKFLAMFSVMFVMFFGIVLSGCENDNNMTLSLSKTNIEITLGENESNTATLEAVVENAKTKDISISYDSSDISVSSKSEGDGVSLITVKALRQCKNVEVLVKGVKDSKTFYVSVYEPISSISSKQDYFTVEYDFEKGGSFSLSSDLVNILPNGTNQTGLKYSLSTEISDVSIENNVLKVKEGLTNVPEKIDVKVTSVYKSDVSTEITFKVIKAIDISQITIQEDNNVLAKSSYNIPRNNTNKNTLLLKVVVPFTVTQEELDVKEMYAYGDIGLKVNESSIQKTDNSYIYSFLFGFGAQTTSMTMVDKIWFNLSYKDYPTISQSTQNMTGDDANGVITITAYDEVTGIGCYVNDTKLSSQKVNLYTSYNNTFGLKVRFDTLPTNALNSKLVLHIAQSDADYVLVKNEKGETLLGQYANSEKTIEFDSGTNFYFVANKSKFENDKEIKLTITSQDSTLVNDIKQEITLVLKEGIDNYGFGTSADALTKSQEYYLENKGNLSQNTIVFGVSPATTYVENLEIKAYGDVFETVASPVKDETISDNLTSFYRLTIKAKQGTTGTGTLTLKFETGQELTANITVIERFETADVNLDFTNFSSSSVGKISQDGETLTYVAIKNNKMLPLKYTTNVKISKVEYAFQDCLYSDFSAEDVYDENSAYTKFNNNYDINNMVTTSAVIDADILRENKYVSTLAIGKVWVKFSFIGEILNQNYELEEFSIDKFVLFEVYNPVEYLNVSDKIVSLYAYSEVGEVNKSKTMATFTVEINDNATYGKLLFGTVEGRLDLAQELNDNDVISIYSSADSQLLFEISKLEGVNNKYTVKSYTRTEENVKYLYVFASDILGSETSFEKTITFVTNKANLVDKITVTNVNEENGEQTIYLNSTSLSTEYSENNFKILTKVTPVDTSCDALCSDVAYIFYPASGTSSNIVSISNEGVVSVTGEFGGKGVIRIIPRDAILKDTDGTTYYRENMPYVDINIVVLDGQTKETAKRVYSESDFTNESLHYMLMNDINITSTIFNEFSGGLYGQNIGSSTIWTISTTATLFGKVLSGAIVEDILVCCDTSNGSGAITSENYGTIQNVTVDAYYNGKNSTVYSSANYVGGLVGENYGTIQNCSFSGSVLGDTANSTVGAITGKNSGTIGSCKVLFYALSNQSMKLTGKITSALVGEMVDNGTLSLSYAYNFTDSDVGAIAGIVGKISAQSVRVEKCFSELNNVEKIYFELDSKVTNVNAVVKDCYTLSSYKNSDDEIIYKFNYIMTKRNNTTLLGTYLSTDTTKTYDNVAFGYDEVWANGESSNKNYGFPYLNEVIKISAVSSEELENIQIQKTSLSLASEDSYAILMLTTTNQSVTSKEREQISWLNLISYTDLFGITNSTGLVVKSDNSDVISCQNNTLKIVNIGECKLTVSSKYDSSIAPKEFNIKVLNVINNFKLLYGSTEIANGVTVGLKKNSTEIITSEIKSNISLNDKTVPLVLEDLKVKFVNQDGSVSSEIVGERVGLHYVNLTTDESKVLSVYLYLDGLDLNYQKVLTNNTKRMVNLKPYNGASSIVSSVENASISATDTLNLQLNISSDEQEETLACDIFDENGVKVYDSNGESFDGKTNINLAQGSIINITILSSNNNSYKLQVELNKNQLKKIQSSYYILRFYADNNNSGIYTDIKIIVLDQEIERIDIYTYSYKDKENGGELYNYYPTNTITNNEPSLIDLMIYPSYANFAYLTVTSDVVGSEKLSLLSLRKGSEDGESSSAYYTNYLTNAEALKDENGIKIINKGDQESEVARFYIRALATSSVTKDTVFNLTIKVYNSNNEVILTQIHSILVSPPQKAGLSIVDKEMYENKYYALVGETLTVKMVMERDQWIEDYDVINDVEGVETTVGVLTFNNDFTNIDAKYKQCTFTLELNDECYDDFTIQVKTKRKINGKEDTITATQKVYIIPFELDFTKTEVSGSAYTDVAIGDIYFKHTLNFNLGANYTESGNVDYTKFVSSNYIYNDHNYSVNMNTTLYKNKAEALRNNLYFVNTVDGKQSYTSIYNSKTGAYVQNNITNIVEFSEENGEIHFIGNNVGEQKMRLVMNVTFPDGTIKSYNFDFTIQIKAELNDDEPQQIYSAQEFLEIFNQTEADNYILMNDINLYDYTPIASTSAVASLDGNGYTISIVSFANDLTNYSLFETIDSTTLIKNLKVNTYNVGLINVDSSSVNVVNIAPIAITNNGIITNTEVVNFFNKSNIGIKQQTSGILLSSDFATSVEAKTAGFVITNNGNITNSRVGDDDGETYTIYKTDRASGDVYTKQYTKSSGTLSEFTINSFGDIAGFVYQNNGHITSSYASNLRIVNNSDVDYTTKTAGFVVENLGEIEMSYAKGVKTQSTDVHATLYGIETSGTASGFVYLNEGEISDCYSNINLTNKQNNPGRTSAGFVYENAETGNIVNSLSLSRIINSTTTQMNFSGVDELGNYLSSGKITNSYYYDQVAVENNTTQTQSAYGESASSVSSVVIQDYFYGFNFANLNESDGVWKMTSVGPELISANNVAVSLRYVSEKSETLSTPKTTYANGYEYGSKNNPIVIRNAKEYNEAFAGNTGKSVDRFVNLANKTITGSYRLISDIDLHELATETGTYTLNSSSKTLYGNGGDSLSTSVGKFDGNGFSIKNLSLTNTADNDVESFGMFAKLENSAMIINLNIVLGDQNTEKEIFGIEAKNVKFVGTVAGIVEDSKLVNIAISALQNADNVTVRGRNAVGGIVGILRGKSSIVNSKTEDINVTSAYYPDSLAVGQTNYINYNKYERLKENTGISYAGGVVGIVDYYTNETKNEEQFENNFSVTNSSLIVVKNVGKSIIEGGIVGGIAGYVGPLSSMQDVQYMPYSTSVSDYAKQGLYSYNGFAGGIAGVNKGYLRQVRSEYDNINTFEAGEGNVSGLTLAELIELNSLSYYNTESGQDKPNSELYNYELGNKQLFQKDGYSPLIIGGLVGLQLSGKIEKSYSKLNVTSNTAKIAGGIVGVIETINDDSEKTTLSEVYATGDVFATQVVSGIAGIDKNADVSKKATSFEKVNALNLWSMVLSDKTYFPQKYTITNKLTNESGQNFEIKTSKVSGFEQQTNQWERLTENTKSEAEEKFEQGYNFGVYYDKIFTANSWDTNFWQRNDNELYPHMVFGYFDRTIKIEVQADIEKLRTNSGSTNGKITYVLDPIDDGNNIISSSGNQKLLKVTKYVVPIVGFSSILSGAGDSTTEVGFYFEKSSRPLFESTINGATFSGFSVYYKQGMQQNTIMSQTSAFVKTASNTNFTNLTFNDVSINASTTGSLRAGIICAVATGECLFTNVKINDCTITVSRSSEAYVGAVFGEGNLSSSSQIDVELKRITIKGQSVKGGDKSSYIGLAMGYVSNFGTIIINSTDENDPNKISGIEFKSVENAEIGLLIGHIEATDKSSLSFKSKNDFSAKIDIDQIQNNSKIGGLFGYAKNTKLDSISFTPNISICSNSTKEQTEEDKDNAPKFTDSIFGGIVGFAQNCTLQNITLGSFEQNSGIVQNKGTMTIKNVAKSNYIGSFVGVIQGNSLISNIVSYASLDVSLNQSENETSTETKMLYIGGVAGKMQSVKMTEEDNVRSYGDILIRFENAQKGYRLALGGVAGTIVDTTLQNCYTTGNIMLVLPSNNTSDNIENKDMDIYVSGLVGYVEAVKQEDNTSDESAKVYAQSLIKNSISAGNVYPTYQIDGKDITKSLEYTSLLNANGNKDKSIYTAFYYGGLVGKIADENILTLQDNISLNTLFNKLDNSLTGLIGNYHANALVGLGECKEQTNNNYANVYTLTIDTIGTNHKFGDKEISDALDNLMKFDKDSNKKEYFLLGTKINPNRVISTLGDIKDQYVYLDPSIAYKNQAIGNLVNSVIISDGAEFVFDEDFEKNTTDKIAPIDSIDKNSIVAGVVTSVKIDNKKNSVAGFARQNAGIIYSCNVVGGRNFANGNEQGRKDSPIRGLVQSTKYASGFVDTNLGFIKNCFTYLDVRSTFSGETTSTDAGADITVAGFARVNTGYITTSYVTGEISNINEDESKSCSGKMYLFAPGYVYNSYSIARMVDKNIINADNHYSFEEDKAEECFYDEYGAEAKFMQSTTFARNIDYDKTITLDYLSSSQSTETNANDQTVNTGDESSTTQESSVSTIELVGDFGQVITNSFGYKSFVGGAYDNLDYMQFYTGSGEQDDPYKIPNLGKLRQMSEISNNTETIYFKLDNDMDGSHISENINWQPKTKFYNISNIVLNGAKVDYEGNEANENYEISNLKSQNQGLFNIIKDSTIKNIDLKNLWTNAISNINKDETTQLYYGLLACCVKNSTMSNVSLKIDLSKLNKVMNAIEESATFGLLIGKVDDEITINSKSSNIDSCSVNILYSDKNSSLMISNQQNWTIGGLIGELKSGTVRSAILTGTKESFTDNTLETLPTFSVQFNDKTSKSYLAPSDDNGIFVIGGIVGKQTGGVITNTGLYCNIDAFTNEEQWGIDQILKVGGIVGESTVTTQNSITLSYTDSKVNITGGNIYSFKKTYVAGICGYGGTIYQCKNEASIMSQASYYYKNFRDYSVEDVTRQESEADTVNEQWLKQKVEQKEYKSSVDDDGNTIYYKVNDDEIYFAQKQDEDTYKIYKGNYIVKTGGVESVVNGFTRENVLEDNGITKSVYSQYYNCYEKGMYFDSYNKLLFARIKQEAYAGGIANCYTKVELSLNTSDEISGGMDSKNLHSVYSYDGNSLAGLISTTTIAIVAGDTIFDASATIPGVRWIGTIVGLAVAVAPAVAAEFWNIGLGEYYFGGNGYSESTQDSYYIGGQYNNDSWVTNERFVAMGLNMGIKLGLTAATKVAKIASNAGMETIARNLALIATKKIGRITGAVLAVAPFAIDIASGVIPQFVVKDSWILPIGRISPYNAGMVTKESFANVAQNYSKVINKFTSNSQDYYASENLEIYDIYFDSIGFPASGGSKTNSYSTTQVYEKVTNGNNVYYRVNDNSKVSEESTNSGVSASEYYGIVYNSSVMNKLTKAQDPSDLLDKGYEKVGDDYKLPSQTQKSSMEKLLNNVKVEGNVITININYSENEGEKPNEIYNKAAEMINEIYPGADSDTYKKKQSLGENEGLFDKIVNLVVPKDSTYSYIININTSIDGVSLALGTNYPFIGKITGNGTVNKTISGINVPSLIDKGKDVVVCKLNLSYNEVNVTDNTTSLGGVIATAEGETMIERVNVQQYSISTYNIDIRGNTNTKQTGINIGGMIGKNEGNATIVSSSIGVLNVNIKADSDQGNENTYGIGGFVGQNTQELSILDSKIIAENIYSKNSKNDIYGGAVGLNKGNLTAQALIIGNDESSIDVESSLSQTIVGGFVGKIESGSQCSFEDIQISLKGVYAKTSIETSKVYAGGFIGYDNAEIDETTLQQIYIGDENSEIKMLVYAGIGGSKFANESYASDIIGNRKVKLDETCSVNVTSKAFAKPTYNNYAKDPEAKSTQTINSQNVVKSSKLMYVENDTGYLKIDLYEYKTESYNDGEDAKSYVNGEKYIPYNYQKSYLLSVIVATIYSKESTATGVENRIGYSERFYRINVTGAPSLDDELDIGCSYSIDFIAYNEYVTDKDIYGSYKNSAYPLQKRYLTYIPIDLKTTYKQNSNISDLSKLESDSQSFVVTKDIVVQTIDESSETRYKYFDKITNTIKVNYAITTDKASVLYQNIYIDNNYMLKMSTKDNVTTLHNNCLAKFYSSTPEDSDNTKSNYYGYVREKTYSLVTSETLNRFAFMYNIKDDNENGYSERFYDIETPLYIKEESNLTVYSKTINIDRDNTNYRKIYIISEQKIGSLLSEYHEYIYIVSSDGRTYYMGDIEYKYATLTDDTISNRTGLFFPYITSTVTNEDTDTENVNAFIKDCDYYRNNLLSLTDVKESNEYRIDQNISTTENIWYFDVQDVAQNPENELNSGINSKYLYKQETTTTRTDKYVFTITLSGITLNVITGENSTSSPSKTKQNLPQGIFSQYDASKNKEVPKLQINYATWTNATNGKYDFKGIKINYSLYNSNDSKDVTFIWSYDDLSKYTITELKKGTSIVYSAQFETVGDISYRITNNKTLLKFGSDTQTYTIAGEYSVEKSGENYKLKSQLSNSKISYIVIDKNGNVLEIVYKQQELFVKEDYTNNSIIVSKEENFDDSQTISHTFDEKYDIKVQSEIFAQTYLTKNNDTMMMYYSLNSTSDDSMIQLFSENLDIMQRVVKEKNGKVIYAYKINGKLTIYSGTKEVVKDKEIDATLDIDNISLDYDGYINFVQIGDTKIDISNGLTYIGTESDVEQKCKYVDFTITYDVHKYEEKTVFNIYQNGETESSGEIVVSKKDAKINGLWAINHGEYVIECSDGKYYSLDGLYYYTGNGITDIQEKTYTALGGLSAKFTVYSVSLTRYGGEKSISIKQKVIIQTSMTTNSLISANNSVSFDIQVNEILKLNDENINKIKGMGYTIRSYGKLTTNGDNKKIATDENGQMEEIWQLTSDGKYSNGSESKDGTTLENEGYEPFSFVKNKDTDDEENISLKFDNDGNVIGYLVGSNQTQTVTRISRTVSGNIVTDKLYSDDELLITYKYTIGYMFTSTPDAYSAVRVAEGNSGEKSIDLYEGCGKNYGKYVEIDGLNMFGLNVVIKENEQ